MFGPTRVAMLLELLVVTSTGCRPAGQVDRSSVRLVDAAAQRPSPPPTTVGGSPDGGPEGRDADAPPGLDAARDAAAAPPDAGSPEAGVDCCRVIVEDASSPPDARAGADTRPAPDAVDPADGPGPPGERLPLPLLVTEHFLQQGWFADPNLALLFTPGSTIIRAVESGTGPCAARVPGARGRCIEVTYTPPADLVPPATGGWVGSYFLTALREAHPDQSPPAQAGDGNWGIEPGLPVARGADRISLNVATDQPGFTVGFGAGSTPDGFVLPETIVSPTAAWSRLRISLAGVRYDRVLTPLGWQLHDTTRPAHFYLDDIAWEDR